MSSISRLVKEFTKFTTDPLDGVTVNIPDDANYYRWDAIITGPADTPYEGGTYMLHIDIPKEYPHKPPDVKFKTHIFHPNISPQSGYICLDILKHMWSPAMGIGKVILSILQLLSDPNPNDSLNWDAGSLMKSNIAEYTAVAKKWNAEHAMSKN